jgi:hypothetical protein
MARVFVVQQQMRREGATLVPKFDLAPAAKFGALSMLLSPTAAPFNPGHIIAELQDKLRSFSDDDYLLLVGNPCLIGMTVAIAAQANSGRVRMLQWSGRDQSYRVVRANVQYEGV